MSESEPLLSSKNVGGYPPRHPVDATRAKSISPARILAKDITRTNSDVIDEYRNEKYPSKEVLYRFTEVRAKKKKKKNIAKNVMSYTNTTFREILNVEYLDDDSDIVEKISRTRQHVDHDNVEVGGSQGDSADREVTRGSFQSKFKLIMSIIFTEIIVFASGAQVYNKILVPFGIGNGEDDDMFDMLWGVTQGAIISLCWLVAIYLLRRQEMKERSKEVHQNPRHLVGCFIFLRSIMILAMLSLFGPVGLFFGIIRLFIGVERSKGMSMYPTLENSCVVLVDGMLANIRPRPFMRNEIVHLYRPKMQVGGKECPAHVVKRIVAIEGDEIEMFGGILYINSVKQEEPFITEGARYRIPLMKVPNDHVLVLGDNRNVSFDGHNYGTVSTKRIICRCVFKLKPFGPLHS